MKSARTSSNSDGYANINGERAWDTREGYKVSSSKRVRVPSTAILAHEL